MELSNPFYPHKRYHPSSNNLLQHDSIKLYFDIAIWLNVNYVIELDVIRKARNNMLLTINFILKNANNYLGYSLLCHFFLTCSEQNMLSYSSLTGFCVDEALY